MKISRESPCHRRHHRISTPLSVDLLNHSFPASNWGMGGVCIDQWKTGLLAEGDKEWCKFRLPFQGFEINFEVEFQVVRICKNRQQLAFKFLSLSERQIELLSHFVENLIRGSMTSIDDTILRIDTPVTPVSTDPDPSPSNEVPVSRWPQKLIITSALYLSVGLSLFIYIVFLLYANFLSLEVDSGVVAAPVERIVSTTDGRIKKVNVELNTLVKPGQTIIHMEDSNIEEAIALAQIEIDSNRALLQSKQEQLALELEKLYDYRSFAFNKRDQAKANHLALSEQVLIAKHNTKRLATLYKKKLVSEKLLDDARAVEAELRGKTELARIEYRNRQAAITALENGRYFTGDQLEGNSKELKAEVDRLKQEVSLASQSLLALYAHRDRLNINAPSQGRIVEMLKSSGSSTKRGETIALFERDEQRFLEVYLTQEEVINIQLAQAARIYFPSLDMAVDGQVINIDRTEGYLHQKESRYGWRASEDRTAKVTISFLHLEQDLVRSHLSPGLPAVVIFPHIATGTFGDWLRSFRSQTQSPCGELNNQANCLGADHGQVL